MIKLMHHKLSPTHTISYENNTCVIRARLGVINKIVQAAFLTPIVRFL
jgi:hypothetical protein